MSACRSETAEVLDAVHCHVYAAINAREGGIVEQQRRHQDTIAPAKKQFHKTSKDKQLPSFLSNSDISKPVKPPNWTF